ncbi:RDD [Bartonella choladocola]|uniref:RDD family protein n=1 Tax=Bartonella choladocola TaxID=2750995 RepID=UPI00399766FE
MNQKNYLWLRFFARTFDAFLYIFLFMLLSLFLRTINNYIVFSYVLSPYYSYFVSRVIEFTLSICEFYIFIFSIDCLIYHFTGNNLGKMILGLKIVNADTGNNLNLSDYSDRTMRQMFSGFCLGIPLLYFITFFIQYNIVFQKNRASYDKKVSQSSVDGKVNLRTDGEETDLLYDDGEAKLPTGEEKACPSSDGEEADLPTDDKKASLPSDGEKINLPSVNESDIANKIVRQPIPIFNYIFFAATYIFLFLSIGFISKLNLGIYPY